jgi:hypothetical protein
MADGQSSVVLKITPNDDATVEWNEQVRIKLVQNPASYPAGTFNGTQQYFVAEDKDEASLVIIDIRC